MRNLMKTTLTGIAAVVAALGFAGSASANSIVLELAGGGTTLSVTSGAGSSTFTVTVFALLGPTGGGQLSVNPSLSYNWKNRSLAFDQVTPVRTYALRPNQCLLFVKTFNSLHSVRPLQLPDGAPLRKQHRARTLTTPGRGVLRIRYRTLTPSSPSRAPRSARAPIA